MGQAHVVGRHDVTPTGLTRVALSVAKRRTASALAGFETPVRLVDHIGPAATTDDAVVAVTIFQRLQGIANLHGLALYAWKNASAAPSQAGQ
jgi:hypothetical protein